MRFSKPASLIRTAGLGVVMLCLAPLATPLRAADEAPAKSALAQQLEQRYEVRGLRDSVLLRPLSEHSAVRSIEITDGDDVLVNGKEFNDHELQAFLGEDGKLVRELVDLGRRQRREVLGLWTEPQSQATPGEGIDIHVPIPPEPPRRPRIHVGESGDDRVSVGHSIHIKAGEHAGEVVCIGCSVKVAGETSDDVVSIGGSVSVSGRVGGGVTAIGGSVVAEDGSEIDGDAVSVGGGVETHGNAQIHGQNTSVGLGGPFFHGWQGGNWGFPWAVFSDAGRLIAAILRTGLLALLAVAAVLLARPAVESTARRVAAEPWKAAFAGLLSQLVFLPMLILTIVVLAVSIIGIPLLVLVPFAIMALIVGMFFGFVAVARNLGAWAERRFGWSASSLAMAVVVGVVFIQAISLVGRLISLPGGWFAVLGFSLVGFGFFLKYLAWTIGLGAIVLAAFSGEWRRSSRSGAAAPQPPVEPVHPVEPVEAGTTPSTAAEPEAPAEEPPPPPPPPPPGDDYPQL